MSLRINKRRHTRIGGTNKPASGFLGAHLYHLQVLPRTISAGKPRIIGQGHQKITLLGIVTGQVGVGHFITNRCRQTVTFDG